MCERVCVSVCVCVCLWGRGGYSWRLGVRSILTKLRLAIPSEWRSLSNSPDHLADFDADKDF